MSHASASTVLEMTEKRAFRLRLHDRSLDDMELVGEWEGFAKMRHAVSGLHLIVLMAENRIVSGSPSLMADLGIAPQVTPAGVKDGEVYVGVIKDDDGKPLHHLVLLLGEFEGPWQKAIDWAKANFGDLPTRAEQRLLFEKAKGEFKPLWYWSGEQHASNSDYAWVQVFSYGGQDDLRKSYEGRARAVRRLPI